MLRIATHSVGLGLLAFSSLVVAGRALPALAQAGPGAEGSRCAGPVHPTPAQTEGPFFKPHSPRRHDLLSPGVRGERLVLTGRVLTLSCRPVPNARIDLWQADGQGRYDNAGYKLRGHEFTDEDGRYWFTTVLPGEYPGRTPHVHLKITVPGRPTLTTQLYFPDAVRNREDGIFDPALTVRLSRQVHEAGRISLTAWYDFFVESG